MMRAAGMAERNEAAEGGPFSAEFQAAVRSELETMLRAPIFVQSSRCKRFLSFIVEQTLSGNAGHLKERTIGIGVFERANDYDTGDDSIVRVTANEVRKRISQFHQESAATRLIQIDLPRGSYVPEFRIQPPRRTGKQVDVAPPDGAGAQHAPPERSIAESLSSALPIHIDADEHGNQRAGLGTPARHKVRHRVLVSAVVIILAAGVAVFAAWRAGRTQGVPDLWDALMHSNVPVLICIDTHDLQPLVPQQSANGESFVDLVLRRQIISLDDAAIVSTMAGELGKRHIPFRVVGAEQSSLSDLRRQPVILIGAIENKWTLLLTRPLRYRIEVANPPGSRAQNEPIGSIVDSQHPENSSWVTDFSVPYAAWKNDYAIVARMDDSTTGVPALIEAGLGNDGTIAASEFITSGATATALANEPSCKGKRNFEAVIETQIIDTKSGPPHVLRLTCW